MEQLVQDIKTVLIYHIVLSSADRISDPTRNTTKPIGVRGRKSWLGTSLPASRRRGEVCARVSNKAEEARANSRLPEEAGNNILFLLDSQSFYNSSIYSSSKNRKLTRQ